MRTVLNMIYYAELVATRKVVQSQSVHFEFQDFHKTSSSNVGTEISLYLTFRIISKEKETELNPGVPAPIRYHKTFGLYFFRHIFCQM